MLLIITCSQDATTDMLLPFLDGIDVFRFDINKWNEYAWDFSSDGFVVQAPDGKQMRESDLKCVYLRKPMFLDSIDVPADGCLTGRAPKSSECGRICILICAPAARLFSRPIRAASGINFRKCVLQKNISKCPNSTSCAGSFPTKSAAGNGLQRL